MAPRSKYISVNINNLSSEAICDRCGFFYDHNRLSWQYEYRGMNLANTQLLVCPTCMDIPNVQAKTIVLPADPIPTKNPRPFNRDAAMNDYRTTISGNKILTQDSGNRILDTSAAYITGIPDL